MNKAKIIVGILFAIIVFAGCSPSNKNATENRPNKKEETLLQIEDNLVTEPEASFNSEPVEIDDEAPIKSDVLYESPFLELMEKALHELTADDYRLLLSTPKSEIIEAYHLEVSSDGSGFPGSDDGSRLLDGSFTNASYLLSPPIEYLAVSCTYPSEMNKERDERANETPPHLVVIFAPSGILFKDDISFRMDIEEVKEITGSNDVEERIDERIEHDYVDCYWLHVKKDGLKFTYAFPYYADYELTEVQISLVNE